MNKPKIRVPTTGKTIWHKDKSKYDRREKHKGRTENGKPPVRNSITKRRKKES